MWQKKSSAQQQYNLEGILNNLYSSSFILIFSFKVLQDFASV
jgi:hypothetical protein